MVMNPLDFQTGVVATDQVTVLKAVVQQIQTNVVSLGTNENCFVSDVPDPGEEVQDNLLCTVCPYGGAFDDQQLVGAGSYGVFEASRLLITIWSRIDTDRLERSYNAATDPDRGLLVLKQQILMALAGQQLFNADSQPILTEHLRPLQSLNPPGHEAENGFSSLGMVFEASFIWDLQ